MNCVGFENHKYFFLLVVYAVADLLYIAVTMSTSVARSVLEETPPSTRFLLVLGMSVALLVLVATSLFLCFHVWLMLRGMTTIEFCEKGLGQQDTPGSISYDVGFYRNIKSVLGPYWFLWLLPLSPPDGTGLTFPSGRISIPSLGNERAPQWTSHDDAPEATA